MTQTALFAAQGDHYRPLDAARGFWARDSIHGRGLVGLLGYEVDRRHTSEGMVPARFNVDLHRQAPFGAVRVETRVLREGRRLRLTEALLYVDDVECARGQCQFLRTAEQPEGRVWTQPFNVPQPEVLEPIPDPNRRRLAEIRVSKGGFAQFGPRQVWMRERFDLVEGVAHTPWSRLVMSVDFGSPWAHMSDVGLRYINTDIILQVHRLPVGDHIGFESTGHEASQGIAVGNCRIFDREGPIGYVSATAMANERRR